MSRLGNFAKSSVGKKWLTGITGVALVAFVIIHLLENLILLGGKDAFNGYVVWFHGMLGPLLYPVEIGLGLAILYHAYLGIEIALGKRKSRKQGYDKSKSAGGASKKSLASVTMPITGVLLLIFLILHIRAFRFGAPPVIELNGREAHDLYSVVAETFQNPAVVIFYTVVMLLLGLHLRHGFWSMFQSLGMSHPRYSALIYGLAAVVATVLAVGFIFLPIFLYFTV